LTRSPKPSAASGFDDGSRIPFPAYATRGGERRRDPRGMCRKKGLHRRAAVKNKSHTRYRALSKKYSIRPGNRSIERHASSWYSASPRFSVMSGCIRISGPKNQRVGSMREPTRWAPTSLSGQGSAFTRGAKMKRLARTSSSKERHVPPQIAQPSSSMMPRPWSVTRNPSQKRYLTRVEA
jgi:hypothetical protein